MTGKRAYTALAATLLLAAFLVGGCSGSTEPSGPQPGQLTVNLSTTGGGGSAFLLTVSGSGITNPVAASAGHQLYSFASGNTLKVAVVGNISTGALMRFSVPDVNQSGSYSVTLNEAAGSDNSLQNVSDYSATISR